MISTSQIIVFGAYTINGGYSRARELTYVKKRLWSILDFFQASELHSSLCKIEEITYLAAIISGEMSRITGMFLMMINLAPLLRIDREKLDIMLSKYYPHRIEIVLKIISLTLTISTLIHTFLLYVVFAEGDVAWMRTEL